MNKSTTAQLLHHLQLYVSGNLSCENLQLMHMMFAMLIIQLPKLTKSHIAEHRVLFWVKKACHTLVISLYSWDGSLFLWPMVIVWESISDLRWPQDEGNYIVLLYLCREKGCILYLYYAASCFHWFYFTIKVSRLN